MTIEVLINHKCVCVYIHISILHHDSWSYVVTNKCDSDGMNEYEYNII